MPFILKSFRQTLSWMALSLVLTTGLAYGQFPQSQNSQPQKGSRPFPLAQPGQRLQQNLGAAPKIEILAERPSPKMLMLLDEWERKTAGIDTLHGTFRRYKYDYVFMVEKRAIGQYWFGSPDKARMDFQPDPDVVKEVEKAGGKKLQHTLENGKVFTIEADEMKSWICTGKDILEIHHPPRQYNRMEIPKQYQGQRITDGPMPFLFGMKADSVAKRYKLAFGERHNKPPGQIHIIAYPLVPDLRREFRKAELFLDPKTYHPQAVKLWDPSGNTETTYTFYSPKPFTLVDKLKGPWRVNLLGYKKMQDVKANEGQLPMHEKRTKIPSLRKTVTGPLERKVQ